jgi:hypothetical protein
VYPWKGPALPRLEGILSYAVPRLPRRVDPTLAPLLSPFAGLDSHIKTLHLGSLPGRKHALNFVLGAEMPRQPSLENPVTGSSGIMRLVVTNVNGSSTSKLKGGLSWKDGRSRVTGKKVPCRCSHTSCPRTCNDMVGAHVWIAGCGQKQYIIILCKTCNGLTDSFRVVGRPVGVTDIRDKVGYVKKRG